MISPAEQASWDEIIRKLRAYVRKRINNPSDCDDLVQDIVLHALRGLASLKNPNQLGPWLYRIAHNLLADYGRAQGKFELLELPEDWDAPEEENADNLLQSVAAYLRLLTNNLPPAYREALILTEFEGFSQSQAAVQAGVSLSGMKSRVQRGRLLLKASLETFCQLEVTPGGKIVSCEPKGCEHCRC